MWIHKVRVRFHTQRFNYCLRMGRGAPRARIASGSQTQSAQLHPQQHQQHLEPVLGAADLRPAIRTRLCQYIKSVALDAIGQFLPSATRRTPVQGPASETQVWQTPDETLKLIVIKPTGNIPENLVDGLFGISICAFATTS